MSYRDHEPTDTAASRIDGESNETDDLLVVREGDHFLPGEYVAASVLCGCSSVCLAPLDNE